jgi:hypothetical protein
MERKKRFGYLLVALAVTLACVPVLPAVAPLPTQPVGAVDTIVAGTYAAASTGTAVNTTPSLTPTPLELFVASRTPTITPTGTATIIFKIPTVAFSSGAGGSGGSSGSGVVSYGPPPEFACKLIKVTPLLGARIAAGKKFNTTWQVTNQGASAWDANSVDYQYASGSRLHQQPLYDLPFSVPPGNTAYLVVAMQAPAKPGTYASTWVMHVSNQFFCKLDMKIVVR